MWRFDYIKIRENIFKMSMYTYVIGKIEKYGKKMQHVNTKHKKTYLPMLISGKVYFRKNNKQDKK